MDKEIQCGTTEAFIDSGWDQKNLVNAIDNDDLFDEETHQSAIYSQLYLLTRTRTDITYAVSSAGCFSAKQTTMQCWIVIKRIFRYLNGTVNFGLPNSEETYQLFTGYREADQEGGFVYIQAERRCYQLEGQNQACYGNTHC